MTRATSLLPILLLLVPAALGQARRGTVTKPARLDVDARLFDASRLVVKFAEGSGVRLRGGQLEAPPPADLAPVRKLLDGARIERLFTRAEADLDAERAALLAALPQTFDPPADLNLYYLAVAKDAAAGLELCRRLNDLAVVEIAFPDHRPGLDADPDDIPPPTPDFTARQGYFTAAPNGIDVFVSQSIPGGRGEKLQILDIETGLILDHEDVPEAVQKNVIGANNTRTDHGLAVAGEMVAARNGYGVTGGVFRARYKFHSHQSQYWASSVSTATANSQPGDVIVLEVHLPHPSTNQYVPMEHRQDVFDAVRTATLKGIHVVAAAGNGNQDLDGAVYQRIFDRTFRDSGSVLVGATNGVTLARASFSNYGSIVDANGWGYNVATSGYTDLFYPNSDARQKYTATFSGTSSATPIVTCAAVALVSAAKQQLGRTLSPREVRDLLRAHGTDVPNGRIGPRPDLAKLLPAIGLPRGLRLRETARLNGQLKLDLEGKAGDGWALLLALGPAEVATPFGRLLVDPASLWLVAAGGFDGAGQASWATAVPNDTALLFQEVHAQAARFDPAVTRLDLTSSGVAFLDK